MLTEQTGTIVRGDLGVIVEQARQTEKLLIGERVLPLLEVPSKSGQYPVVTKTTGGFMKPASSIRTPQGEYGRISGRKFTLDNYDAVDRGIEEPCDVTISADLSRFFNVEAATTRWIWRQMMLAFEQRVAALTFNETTFGAATAAQNAYIADNLDNTTPINFIGDCIAACRRLLTIGEIPNTVIVTGKVWDLVIQSALLQDYARGAKSLDSKMTMSPEDVAAILRPHGIEQILIANGIYDSAGTGADFVSTDIWDNAYIWIGNSQAGPIEQGGFGRTLSWAGDAGGLYVVEQYEEPKIRSNIIRIRQHCIEKVIDSSLGTLIATSYA